MELISNIPNEILFVGAIYKHPDYLVEYGHYVKSKYDFADEATKFFYDAALIIYETRTQEFNKTSVLTFMAEDESRLSQYKRLKLNIINKLFFKLRIGTLSQKRRDCFFCKRNTAVYNKNRYGCSDNSVNSDIQKMLCKNCKQNSGCCYTIVSAVCGGSKKSCRLNFPACFVIKYHHKQLYKHRACQNKYRNI